MDIPGIGAHLGGCPETETTIQIVRAARLQNEIAPEQFLMRKRV